jgi:hypothetical protein
MKFTKPCWARSASVGKRDRILEQREHVRHVQRRHPGPVGGAENEAVLVRHRAHVAAGDLSGTAEEAMAVEGWTQRAGGRGLRDHADHVRERGVARDVLGAAVRAEGELGARRAAGGIEEAGHADVAADADRVAEVAAAVELGVVRKVIRDVRVGGEGRLGSPRNQIGEIVVPRSANASLRI